ncbi:MAG TPA: hypothetical protein VML75_05655 [Kofleriaceae bacterium]|nr:hypothetical protein [Kofleriaceae bacterium]
MRWLALASCVFASVAACGGGGGSGADAAVAATDISGWYDSVALLQGDCGDLADTGNAPALVWVEGLGGATFYVRYCSGATEADCFATPFYDFTDPITDGWAAEGGSAFYSAECTLSWERSRATLSGDQLRVHTLRYTDTRAIPQADCTLAAAAALTEPCTFEVELTATRR